MSSTVLNVLILTINIILWLFFYIRYKKIFSPENILHSIRDEVDKLLIEIDKSADMDLTLIEERTNNLRAMIDEADKRIQLAISEEHKAELGQKGTKKLSAETRKAVSAYQKAKPHPAENTNADELTYKPEEHVASPVAEFEEHAIHQNHSSTVAQTELPFEISVAPDFVQTEKTFQQKVIDLWRQGLDTEFIAEKLQVSYAEVQMIVDMYGV